MKNFVQKGDRITYTNNTEAAIASGAVVVVGALVCIACVDIAIGATGALATEGVYEVPKRAHASTAAIGQGEKVIYDISAAEFDNAAATPAAGDITGNCTAWAAAASTATTFHVKLSGTPGVITAGA
jgi:predicted RecA/RadA family phage recombinase